MIRFLDLYGVFFLPMGDTLSPPARPRHPAIPTRGFGIQTSQRPDQGLPIKSSHGTYLALPMGAQWRPIVGRVGLSIGDPLEAPGLHDFMGS